ncbi:hypothetical protein K8Z61_10985 [Nocardioides sp. TRM66260-LWL]|uniref:hypothetical protein n=1 Tax=Nocardioides sp. TRM66260-LWL TaxID=2874478 RepID=UPI001CC740A4|nr:hypothetical protein [Nocardioides sp. TRM66260-LWL]MBZ5735023.1 hypothetical protein [Nocardioides sp. TRM66260-LWL]
MKYTAPVGQDLVILSLTSQEAADLAAIVEAMVRTGRLHDVGPSWLWAASEIRVAAATARADFAVLEQLLAEVQTAPDVHGYPGHDTPAAAGGPAEAPGLRLVTDDQQHPHTGEGEPA